MVDNLPAFLSMPSDGRIWRIDWFGECAYPGSVRRYAQPSIKVAISPLRSSEGNSDHLLLSDCTELEEQREFWAPIAALPMLAIGDLWQNGQLLTSPGYQTEAFIALTVTPETTIFVKAGLPLDERYLLPWSHHPWHRGHTNSYCVAVALDKQRRLLVPCVELIRFYFGSSSVFLQRLFTGPFESEKFWTQQNFNASTKHLHLTLAKGLSGLSAPDIGRIAQSKTAMRSAAGIYASCLRAIAENRLIYPYTSFPFQGTTDLVVSGRWLPFGEQENATFLVYRLRSCSHPFPFRSLSYGAGDRKARATSAEKSTTSSRSAVSAGSMQHKTVVAETDPGVNAAHRTKSISTKHRFPDLVRKSIWRKKNEEIPPAEVFRKKAGGALEQVGLGESDRHAGTPALDVLQQDDVDLAKQLPLLPRFVQQGIQMLNSGGSNGPKEIVRRVVPPEGSNHPVFCLPVVVDDDGVIDEDHLFTEEDGHTRQRRGCFVELDLGLPYVGYLAILEGREPSEPASVRYAAKLEIASLL